MINSIFSTDNPAIIQKRHIRATNMRDFLRLKTAIKSLFSLATHRVQISVLVVHIAGALNSFQTNKAASISTLLTSQRCRSAVQ